MNQSALEESVAEMIKRYVCVTPISDVINWCRVRIAVFVVFSSSDGLS